jgi:hypothetical protein
VAAHIGGLCCHEDELRFEDGPPRRNIRAMRAGLKARPAPQQARIDALRAFAVQCGRLTSPTRTMICSSIQARIHATRGFENRVKAQSR